MTIDHWLILTSERMNFISSVFQQIRLQAKKESIQKKPNRTRTVAKVMEDLRKLMRQLPEDEDEVEYGGEVEEENVEDKDIEDAGSDTDYAEEEFLDVEYENEEGDGDDVDFEEEY